MSHILPFFMFLTLFIWAVPVAAAQTASIEQLSGTVELRRVGQDFFKQATIGQNVVGGDVIRTGKASKTRVRLVDGSTLSFAEESEFMLGCELNETGETLIGTFLRGVTRAVLEKRANSYIATPTGTIGIRGTDITLTHSGKTGFYFLDEGEVGVQTNNSTIILNAGHMTASYAGHKPLPPSLFTKSAGLAEARKKLSALTSVDLPSCLEDHAQLNEILARWIINYAHYLADAGRHEDAETAFLIADDLTGRHAVEGEILLQIGGLYFYRLNDVHGALQAYQRIIQDHQKTPYFEKAMFGAIRCYNLLKQQSKVREYILWYKSLYPKGKYLQELDALSINEKTP